MHPVRSLPPAVLPSATPLAPVRAILPTPLPCAECHDDQSLIAEHSDTHPIGSGYQPEPEIPPDRDHLSCPSSDGRKFLPAAEPEDRCPAHLPLRPARCSRCARSLPVS